MADHDTSPINRKFRIFVMESERGWGQDYWTEDYDSEEMAWSRIHEINEKNTSLTVPDWYMKAEQRVEVVYPGFVPGLQ